MVDPNALKASLKTVAVGVAAGAGIGAALGTLLGLLAPGYYRGVFSGGADPSFAPVSVGLGLGLSQGALVGAALAVAILFRNRPHGRGQAVREVDRTLSRPRIWPLWVAIGALGFHAFVRDLPGLWGPSGPSAAWREGKVVLWNFGLRDKLATHLVAGDAQAPLPSPLLLRSHWYEETVDVARLDWRGPEGERCPPPTSRGPIAAVFVDASLTMR